MKWFLIAFKKYAVFTGRASRQEYWMFVLFSVIISIIASILDLIFDTHYYLGYLSMGYVNTLCQLVLLMPSLAVGVRRLHDVGKTGSLFVWLIILVFLQLWLYRPFIQNISSGMSPDSGSAFMVILFAVTVPVLFIWVLILFCREGDRFDNKFGPDPLANENVQFAMDNMKVGSFAQNIPPLPPLNTAKFTNNLSDLGPGPVPVEKKIGNKTTLAGFVVSFSNVATGEFWEMREGNNAIGSAAGNEVMLMENYVSDKHANINISLDKQSNCWKYQIVDLSAASGTEINGERIPIFSGVEIKDRDKIKIGSYELMLMVVDKSSPQLATNDVFNE